MRASRGNDELMPKSRELDMKEATKRAASEALAQMLAVTAMLVIASVVFYCAVNVPLSSGRSKAISDFSSRSA